MESITVQNYRCFGSEKQTARLAPLTLLVGPNSTGKTSFLALIRALWDTAFGESVPTFTEAPYDLGSFQDIVHTTSSRVRQSDSFFAGFTYKPPTQFYEDKVTFTATYENWDAAPFPVFKSVVGTNASVDIWVQDDGTELVNFRSGDYEQRDYVPAVNVNTIGGPLQFSIGFPSLLFSFPTAEIGNQPQCDADLSQVNGLRTAILGQRLTSQRPLSSAPIRSRPHRTYNPVRPTPDSEGEYIPSYLANLARRDPDEWQRLKHALEEFGRSSGLFDDISVKPFNKSDGAPFEVQIRKSGERRKGLYRNLIDVGYGVSQVLPILLELLRDTPPSILLLQQPEVHLHPSAQAALGSLFGSIAAEGRQLIIETHSDYIIDRVRMEARDGRIGLSAEQVSILYFEPRDLGVRIHSIEIDESGTVLGAPPSYGTFFMDEVSRSIGIRK